MSADSLEPNENETPQPVQRLRKPTDFRFRTDGHLMSHAGGSGGFRARLVRAFFVNRRRVNRGALKAWKAVYQTIRRPGAERRILLVVACPRSGTTMLTNALRRDYRVRNYGEVKLAVRIKNASRLRPVNELREQLACARESLSVIKPLIDAHNTDQLLDGLPNSLAFWLYRDFRSVALSNVRAFASYNPAKLVNLIVNESGTHWVNERLTDETREQVSRLSEIGLSDLERMALVWWVRNKIFFDLGLDKDNRVMVVRYENLVTNPAAQLRDMYAFARVAYPGDRICAEIHSGSARKGADLEYRPEVETLCLDMEARLDALARQPGSENDLNQESQTV